MKTRLLAPLALLCLAGCDPLDEEAPADRVIEPGLDGKTDDFVGVEDEGTLRFGETAEGVFDQDLQFFAYSFSARENAVLDVEITQAGSSRDLDTTLFIYRVDPDAGPPRRIAFDDDEGWGALSRIRDFRLYSEGTYTIVVGTKDAIGRGNFSLRLGCVGGDCEPLAEPNPEPPTASCHPLFAGALEGCIGDTAIDNNYELPIHELVAECRAEVEDAPQLVCPNRDQPVCEDPERYLADCNAQWAYAFVPPARGLTEIGTLSELESTVRSSEECSGDADAGCTFDARLYRYDDEAPSGPALLSFARGLSSVGPGAYLDQELDTSAFGLRSMVNVYHASGALERDLAAAGLDLDQARIDTAISFGDFPWSYGDCEGGVVTATFPESQTVLVVEDLFCFG